MRALLSPAALLLAGAASLAAEPVDQRLLRTIQSGVLQEVDLPEIRLHAKSLETDFAGHVLARSALVVLGEDAGFPEWPLERLLDRTLDLLQRGGSNAFSERTGMPAGFGGDDLVFTLVYALVTTGAADKAIDVLERRLEADSEYARGVAMQALRNIGGARATRLLQKMADAGRDRNLPENLLADLHYPFLEELRARLHLIPPDRRDRRQLLEAAREACGERQALAVYFLGFLPEGAEPGQSRAEMDMLRALTRSPCFHTRYFAVRALALRSAESIEFWTRLLRDEEDGWQRAQVARIAFARFGRQFAGHALRLLADEPVQYVQWELMQGGLETRQGARFRDYWDIWQPTTLSFKLYFPEGGGELAEPDVDEVLSWLETGARPRDPWVRNHLLHRLAERVSGPHLQRYLRVFDAHPEKAQHWWILANLRDARALPLLRYWLGLKSEEPQRAELEKLIVRLEEAGPRLPSGPSDACCRPTRECLLSWLRADPGPGRPSEIKTAEQAKAWLEGGVRLESEPEVRFTDPLGRVALVVSSGQADAERWEHLYGCWRRVGSR